MLLAKCQAFMTGFASVPSSRDLILGWAGAMVAARANGRRIEALTSPEGIIWLDTSIARNNLKSVIARVTRRRMGERFQHKVAGAAWGGSARIERVEVRAKSCEAGSLVIGKTAPNGCGPSSFLRPEQTAASVGIQGNSVDSFLDDKSSGRQLPLQNVRRDVVAFDLVGAALVLVRIGVELQNN
jgi:hypothetical protein